MAIFVQMKMLKNGCDLKSCSFCQQCLPEWLPAVAANRQTFEFKKGEVLLAEGAAVTGFYFLVSGKVKVHSKWDDDKELIVRFAGAGEIVGHRGLGKNLFYPVTVTALENGSACFIPLSFFDASLKVNTGYLYKLLHFYADELQQSERRMRNLAHMPVKGRLANALLFLADKFGANEAGVLQIELSKQDLSAYIGATYETVFRFLGELTEAGMIAMNGRQMQLVDREGLQGVAQ